MSEGADMPLMSSNESGMGGPLPTGARIEAQLPATTPGKQFERWLLLVGIRQH
jgi:hypothetical protein